MPKYKPGDRFIVEITGVDNEASFRGYPHTTYQVKGAGCFSENVLDKLERIEPNMAAALFTNADKIRNMSIDDLAAVIMCPYTGDSLEDLPLCEKELFEEAPDKKTCYECCKAWLQQEVEDANGKNNP